ncbi:MAG: DNA methylase, partial [Flammeovirgaceae bacterium]
MASDSNESNITYAAAAHDHRVISGKELLEYAMTDTSPNLKIKVSSDPDVYIPDVTGMKNCDSKIRLLKEKFYEYTTNVNKEQAKLIERIYNRNINNFVERKYDGSHLTFEGMEHFEPKWYQKDAVWKIVQDEGGLEDQVPGAGKSLVIAMAAIKLKRLGLSNKPLVICLKANVDAVANHFRTAFPNSKILAPAESDFAPLKRRQLFSSISTNEWDVVIIPPDNYLKIPHHPDMVKDSLQEELDILEADLEVIRKNSSLSKRLLKGLEKRKQNLQVSIKVQMSSVSRDDYVMNFQSMGFDHLFVDESHEFKNLPFTTRQQHVAGMGNQEGSAKARNLLYGVRTIQNLKGADKGVTFLTGTPLSNSLVEMYLLKRYLRPKKLEMAGVTSLDAWALMFAKKSKSYEVTVTNELKVKDRYREFVNLPELRMWYREMAHTVTKDDMGSELMPKMDVRLITIDPTKEQLDYIEKLVLFSKTKDGNHIGLGTLSKNEESAYMLIATNLAKKMSLDMRMISSDYQYNEKGKLGTMARTIWDEYQESDRQGFKGVQAVFCDIGTPSGSSFNVYAETKRILVSLGVPASEIVFIHDFDTKQKKRVFEQKTNSGEFRVVIGSTKKLGTGNNFQKNLIALHELDLPWRPSDMGQRGGRLDRQGAEAVRKFRNNTGRRYVYAT